MPECRSCVHFEPHEKADAKSPSGLCRRFPPLAGAGHPRVQSDDHCGEFKPQEK